MHLYLVGQSEGRSVPESIRAGRNLPRRDTSALYGHSYGVRPMNASSFVWTSASSGTSTRGPYWPL